jgi:hypothetical protein
MGNKRIEDIFNFSAEECITEIKIKGNKKEFTKDELNMSISEFWNKYSNIYKDCREENSLNAKSIPISGFLNYFDEYIDREMIYCSIFRYFNLIKQKNNSFKIVGEGDDYEDYKFTIKGDSKFTDVLDKIYKIVRKTHITWMKLWKEYWDSDRCEFYVEGDYLMSEFIIRNSDKYGIDYCYLGSGDNDIDVIRIEKEWI